MENSYGIGIANRYELFLVDEEAGTPTNKAIKKAKQQKKSTASANVAANGAATVEKENKPANSNKASNPASSKPQQQHQQQHQQQQQQQQSATGKSAKTNQNGQQNIRSDRPPRDGKDNKNQDRKIDGTVQNGENREQRYNRNNNNRKPRENQQLNNADGTTGNSNLRGGRNFNNERNLNTERNFNNERFERNNDRAPQNRRPYGGKREFDRQSGSDRTGVKSVDKRDGAGAHNWGTHKQDIDDYNKGNVAAADWDAERDGPKVGKDDKANNGETKPADEQNGKEGNVTEPASVEEETKEITLDEWKAQRAERAKPQYNIRKAGEGEDTSQWKKMVALDNRKKKSDESEEEYEYDPSMYPQRVGRQKFLDIDIHFNDGPRGNVNRRRGRQRGGPRQWNGSNAEGQEIEKTITTQTAGPIPPPTNNNNNNANANANANTNANVTAAAIVNQAAPVNANPINTTTNATNASSTNNTNNTRRRNNQSYRNRQDRGRFDERRQNAPKVDDENDFPSLG